MVYALARSIVCPKRTLMDHEGKSGEEFEKIPERSKHFMRKNFVEMLTIPIREKGFCYEDIQLFQNYLNEYQIIAVSPPKCIVF